MHPEGSVKSMTAETARNLNKDVETIKNENDKNLNGLDSPTVFSGIAKTDSFPTPKILSAAKDATTAHE